MFRKLFYPMQACFLCTRAEDKQNVTFAEWVMPASTKPQMLAVALHKKSFSLELLSKSKQFAICILPESMKDTAIKVKGCSGRIIDKFSEFNIETIPAKEMDVPIVKDALGWAECNLEQMMCLGDYYLVVGEVIHTEVKVDEKKKEPMLLKWDANSYIGMNKQIAQVAKKDDGLLSKVQKAVFGRSSSQNISSTKKPDSLGARREDTQNGKKSDGSNGKK